MPGIATQACHRPRRAIRKDPVDLLDFNDTATQPSLLEPTQDWRAKVPTVSQLTRRLRGHLENTFFDVWVRGEISSYRKPASGHAYLLLKDGGAQLRVCLFRPVMSRLKFALEDGMEVLIHGRVTIYEARGEYQIVGDTVEPVGTGALQLAFEQMKERLAQEGLFSADHKQPLPVLPQRIGVITSTTGAAIRDILKVLSRRFHDREILIFHASVQGDRAAGEIVSALKLVERWNAERPERAVEVLIVGRGGGSLEDLWPFNEESVARALHACPIPILSAVGHETDFTIADFVADVRAPTPSAAAELVLPRKEELVFQLRTLERRLTSPFLAQIEQKKLHLTHLGRRLVGPQQRLAAHRTEFQRAHQRLEQLMAHRARLWHAKLDTLAGKLDSLSPLRVLGRGYTLTQKPDGHLLRSATEAAPGEVIQTRFHDGLLASKVLPS